MFKPEVRKLVQRFLVLAVLLACLVLTTSGRRVSALSCCMACKQSYDACVINGNPPFDCENEYYSCISECPLECPWLPYDADKITN